MFYQKLIRPLLFRCDPEWAHQHAIKWSARAQRIPGWTSCCGWFHQVSDPRLCIDLAGIPLPNPIGLAAGYDKSGQAISAMASLGFGHVEIGSISRSPSPGNPQPRLWRLAADQAVCVHYGLPNDGATAVADHLSKQRITVPLGINLVNTNHGAGAPADDVETILQDYVDSAKTLATHASYLMLNLSCPNTCDGQAFFADHVRLVELLERIRTVTANVPVFLKISPDGNDADLEQLLSAVDPFEFVKGFMFNLSPARRSELASPRKQWEDLPGAISGPPTKRWMQERVASLYRMIDKDRHQIIAAGGVSNGDDAYEMLRAGASAVQLLTALIYQGPGVVRRINQGLLKRIERDGIDSLSQIIGGDR